MIKLEESTLVTKLYEELSVAKEWGISEENWVKLYKNFAEAGYEFLSLAQDKDKKVALVITTPKEEGFKFLLGLVKEYIPNEDNDELGGNWAFTYTFNQEDIFAENTDVRYITDPQFMKVMDSISLNNKKNSDGTPAGFTIAPDFVEQVFAYLVVYLKEWLDKNARENETIDLVLEDCFTASVAVENGEKVIAMYPQGRAKSKIKNDDAVSEEAK